MKMKGKMITNLSKQILCLNKGTKLKSHRCMEIAAGVCYVCAYVFFIPNYPLRLIEF